MTVISACLYVCFCFSGLLLGYILCSVFGGLLCCFLLLWFGVDLRNSVAFFLFSVDLMLLLGMFACCLLFARFRFACLVCLL